jgi:hypothetical protein
MWELTTAHRTLTIRLEQPGRTGNLEIACIDPRHIVGPTEWQDSHVEIESAPDGFLVKDDAAGLRISAAHVELAENRKPANA